MVDQNQIQDKVLQVVKNNKIKILIIFNLNSHLK